MEKSLTDILCEALVGKKIKLYKILDKTIDLKGFEYFITEKGILPHPKKSIIIGETWGVIQSIKTEYVDYEGDFIM